MNGQKGGIKDRIKAWRRFLIERKRRKRIEQELIREKKLKEFKKKQEAEIGLRHYGKLEIICKTFVGLMFGALENWANAPKENVVVELKPGLKVVVSKEIQNRLNKITSNVTEIEKQIETIETIVQSNNETTMNKQTFKQLSRELYEKQEKLNDIKKSYASEKAKIVKEMPVVYKPQTDGAVSIARKEQFEQIQYQLQDTPVDKKIDDCVMRTSALLPKIGAKKEATTVAVAATQIKGAVEEPDKLKKYIKDTSKKIEKLAVEIVQIEQQLKATTDKDEFQKLMNKMNEYRDTSATLLLEHSDMTKKYDFYLFGYGTELYELDKFELLKDNYNLSQLVKECDKRLEIKMETPEKKKEKVEEKKPAVIEEIDEQSMEQLNQVVHVSILRQEEQLNKIKNILNSVEHITTKKRSHLSQVGAVVTNVMKMALGFLTFPFFKNKAVGLLASGMVVNNGLRGLRRAIHPEKAINYYQYENVKDAIKNQYACIDKAREIFDDSLYQIKKVKEEFTEQFTQYSEIQQDSFAIYQQILKLEETIGEKNEQLSKNEAQLRGQEHKVKKLKKKENVS